MPDTVIRVQNLSKRYRLGELHKQTGSFREKVTESFKRLVLRGRDGKPPTYASRSLPSSTQPDSGPLNSLNSFNSLNRPAEETPDYIWALKDVSFEVKRGEVLGIIGRNGAGKTTLLKILSRVTKPTNGKAWINGRLGSLLEVGTGFHPELTGRENVYLNGAILGMTKAEIRRSFDQIVSFAEVEQFIDTPVKRYSNGMYVRLAFAVAAHLEQESLLVDEVLAVGDAGFQKKCLGKMGTVAAQGRTVLFVSHNMAAIRTLCERAIFLQDGGMACDAFVENTVKAYLDSLDQTVSQNLADRLERTGQGQVRLTGINVFSNCELRRGTLATGYPACFTFSFSKFKANLHCTFTIYDQYGQGLAVFSSEAPSPKDSRIKTNKRELICEINELPLIGGRYRINAAVYTNGQLQDHVEGAAFFTVENDAFHGRKTAGSLRYGSVCIPHRWLFPSQ